MKLPAYPLITVDPFFSIWSKTEELYCSDTELWCGIKKRLSGKIKIDGENYRFMGSGCEKIIPQTNLDVQPYITVYTFENSEICLKVSFWTPLVINDIQLLSLPCSFIDYSISAKDKKEHSVEISFSMAEEFCYDENKKPITKSVENYKSLCLGKMGQAIQNPLCKSGDGTSADWGYFYISGDDVRANENDSHTLESVHSFKLTDSFECGDITAFDDIFSIEYFGEKLKSVWTERFGSVEEAILFCKENHDELFDKIKAQGDMILKDSEKYGRDYQAILTAAARQVLAAHKLIRSPKGELLYFSKECHSNGCINTVDVTYPAIPMFLCYNPELVKAMLTGIFEFAKMPCWKFDYAPHDIGTYPLADGQAYALKDFDDKGVKIDKRTVFSNTNDIFQFKYQMPVEECGNMLICSYAYYVLTKDEKFLKDNACQLEGWAEYLKAMGVVLDNQLCTDDFAGHVAKNVNLAIKSIMGIKSFSEICKITGSDRAEEFSATASKNADELCSIAGVDDYLSFSLDNKESWSLKYNLVWDILFGFKLFPEKIYEGESRVYTEKMQEYGVPLDFRKNFTKSDWLMWASVLDKSEKNVSLFAKPIVKYLADTNDRNCFSDWFCTDEPKEKSFNHRSVQAGLWMPVLRDKLK